MFFKGVVTFYILASNVGEIQLSTFSPTFGYDQYFKFEVFK